MNANITGIRLGIIFGGTSIILGAMGAHALENILPDDAIVSFLTAVRYQMYHAFALVAVGLFGKVFERNMSLPIWLFTTGILMFSGSIYGLILGAHWGLSVRWLGPVTPIGGLVFIAGWLVWLWKTWVKN
ncbi:MAG: DUF423 domain-containing protein [Cryomorphaceae bacterium]|nr:DUF423 domain-containing protein [Cryomorphaceae bacterium]